MNAGKAKMMEPKKEIIFLKRSEKY